MNKTEHIFGILGVRKDRDFYIGNNKDLVYRYTNEGLFCSDKSIDTAKILYALIFMADCIEIHEVIPSPWRPKLGEKYWSLNSLGQATLSINENSFYDIIMAQNNNMYKTEKEAKDRYEEER